MDAAEAHGGSPTQAPRRPSSHPQARGALCPRARSWSPLGALSHRSSLGMSPTPRLVQTRLNQRAKALSASNLRKSQSLRA